ncbi:hypothetical protein DFJ74DRAFT_708464 [Hyaloraphidium curvatum]|nr:hypothetical protein DFJ74DRAFT_708464 [Hyaloraphidium curvatum]
MRSVGAVLAALALLAAGAGAAVRGKPITSSTPAGGTVLACADTMKFEASCPRGKVVHAVSATFGVGERADECGAGDDGDDERRRLDEDEEDEEPECPEADRATRAAILDAVSESCTNKQTCKARVTDLYPAAADCAGTGAYLEVKYKCLKPGPSKQDEARKRKETEAAERKRKEEEEAKKRKEQEEQEATEQKRKQREKEEEARRRKQEEKEADERKRIKDEEAVRKQKELEEQEAAERKRKEQQAQVKSLLFAESQSDKNIEYFALMLF